VIFGMTHYPQCNPSHRATRVQLATTPALIKSSDGNRAKARLQVVSVTGGLLQLTLSMKVTLSNSLFKPNLET
jgi:hypothetical protein